MLPWAGIRRRPKSDTITLTKQARTRFNRKVVQNIDTLFDALFDAATKDGDGQRCSPLDRQGYSLPPRSTDPFSAAAAEDGGRLRRRPH